MWYTMIHEERYPHTPYTHTSSRLGVGNGDPGIWLAETGTRSASNGLNASSLGGSVEVQYFSVKVGAASDLWSSSTHALWDRCRINRRSGLLRHACTSVGGLTTHILCRICGRKDGGPQNATPPRGVHFMKLYQIPLSKHGCEPQAGPTLPYAVV